MPELPIVLASASPRRKDLLKQIGLSFEVCPSSINEKKFTGLKPELMVEKLAVAKAFDVADKLKTRSIVIAADTIVVYNNQVLGKPADKKQAFKILTMLSGTRHFVYTGVVLLDSKKRIVDFNLDKTEVKFRKLQEKEINSYIDTGEPFDKAGSYGIQGFASIFISQIKGSYTGVVGLPLHKLALMLKKYSIEIL